MLGLIASIFFGISCKKEDNSTIVGRQSIITDSTFAGVGLGNHPVNYKGRPGDYFDFTTGGYVYTREGNTFDKLHYTLITDTTIIITSFGITVNGVPETCITNLTNHALTITAPIFATPGGTFGRKVSLKR